MFVERSLNIIVERLTGLDSFFDIYEMDRSFSGIYLGKKSDLRIKLRKHAEKKVKEFSLRSLENQTFSSDASIFDYLCGLNESTSIGHDSLETFDRTDSNGVDLLCDVQKLDTLLSRIR